jgi:hypothetical protein
MPNRQVAEEVGKTYQIILRHVKHSPNLHTEVRDPAPTFTVKAGWTPLEEATAFAAFQLQRLETASKNPGANLTAMVADYNRAVRHRDKLNGSLNLTVGQLLKSEQWLRVRSFLVRTLEVKHPDALRDLLAGLEEMAVSDASQARK